MADRKIQPLKPVRETRHAIHDIFNVEFRLLRKYMITYPILSLAVPFLIGLIFGGLLQADITWFLILCMTGFMLPLPFGLKMGIPSYVTIAICIPLQIFIIYAAVTWLSSIKEYPRAEPYLKKMEKKFEPITNVVAGQGGIGLIGFMAVFTFILGWIPIIIIHLVLNLKVGTTMKAAILGVLIAGLVYLAVFEGLLSVIPYPFLIITIMMVLITIVGMGIQKILARRSKKSSN
jgi:hypothetical protein